MATGTLVDSSVVLDILTEDARWFDWSSSALADAAERGPLWIDPIVYAEVSVRFTRIEDLEVALPPSDFRRTALPWEAAFLAGKAFVAYRHRGGARSSTLPDFFIGAHAAVNDWALLTRDRARYQTYFPSVSLVTPDARAGG